MSDLNIQNINQHNGVDFVDITDYAEARHIFNCSIDKFLILAKIQAGLLPNEQIYNDNEIIKHDNINKSILEITTSPLVRMYFDIENIPKEEILFEILNKLIELYFLPNNYAYTKNINSTHEGLSYHVYFPIKAYKSDIYSLIKDFHFKTNYKYFNFIDYRVYGKNRLMRIVGSCCPGKVGHVRNINDFHNLIKGELEDTIIQNIDKLEQFNYTFENMDFVESKFSEKLSDSLQNKNKFSDPAKKTWDLFRYPYNNFIQNQQEIEKLKQTNKAEKIKNNFNIKETELKIKKEKQDKEFELKKIKEERKNEKIKWEMEFKKNKDELELKKQEIELLKLKIQLEKEKRLNMNILNNNTNNKNYDNNEENKENKEDKEDKENKEK